jgi:hypothetical protein
VPAAPARSRPQKRDRLELDALNKYLQGKPVRGVRRVEIPTAADQQDRRLTTLRKEAGVARARLINKVKQVRRSERSSSRQRWCSG